jgi:hypothetical protein
MSKKVPLFPQHPAEVDKKPQMIESGVTECGHYGNLQVQAVTDSAGPQVIVCGKDKDEKQVHLLSRPLKNHQAAEELGYKVVAEGPDCYKKWFDLVNGGTGTALFAIMGGMFR